MKSATKEQIEAVAEWWSVRTFDYVLNQDNGDDSENGPMSFILTNYVSMQARSQAKTGARDKFKQSIIESLSKDPTSWNLLEVDYNPNEVLSKACEDAEIDHHMLPIKSHTQWKESTGTFIGRYKYGSPFETIA